MLNCCSRATPRRRATLLAVRVWGGDHTALDALGHIDWRAIPNEQSSVFPLQIARLVRDAPALPRGRVLIRLMTDLDHRETDLLVWSGAWDRLCAEVQTLPSAARATLLAELEQRRPVPPEGRDPDLVLRWSLGAPPTIEVLRTRGVPDALVDHPWWTGLRGTLSTSDPAREFLLATGHAPAVARIWGPLPATEAEVAVAAILRQRSEGTIDDRWRASRALAVLARANPAEVHAALQSRLPLADEDRAQFPWATFGSVCGACGEIDALVRALRAHHATRPDDVEGEANAMLRALVRAAAAR